jgi:general secretion pathway protein A
MNVRPADDKQALVDGLEQHLSRMHQRGRLVVVILDESQDLPAASLEELRLLWNWEQGGRRLAQIILIGQPELRRRLLEAKWEPLRQRIVLSYHLGPLSRDDTAAYIRHRLKVAGDDGCAVSFTPEAVMDIYAAKSAASIDRPIVHEVLRDMTCWGLRTSPKPPETLAVPAAGGRE